MRPGINRIEECPECGGRLIAHVSKITPCKRYSYIMAICPMCKWHDVEYITAIVGKNELENEGAPSN